MQIDPATHKEIFDVAMQMRERDFYEFTAVCDIDTREELAFALMEQHGPGGGAMCAKFEGEPVAIGALVVGRPGVATLLFYATSRFPKVALPLTRWIKWELFPRYREAGTHRIECASIEGYDQAHRWIEMLGLHREAVMPGYGKRGETFHQFAMVKDVGPTGA